MCLVKKTTKNLYFCKMGNKISSVSVVNPDGASGTLNQGRQPPVGCLHTRRGGKGVNQDSAILYQRYEREDGVFCGVFDGHGKNGHSVSRIVKHRLPLLLLEQKRAILTSENSPETQGTSDDASSSNRTFLDWERACVHAFEEMDEEIKLVKKVDASFSGSTAVVVIRQGDELIIANLGDSRAILGTKQDNKVKAVQLTTDLKPGTPDELERIERSNGRVFALRAEPELQRAWLPRVYSPGMAMSRAFGDMVMKNYGIIATPVVTHHILTPNALFVVLATDGIWDVLSNEEVIAIVCGVESKEMAAKAVVDAAATAWRAKYPRDKPDDCTAICFFLQTNNDQPHAPAS